jgi:hypothetical protein
MNSRPDPSHGEPSGTHPLAARIARAALALILPAAVVGGLYLRPFVEDPTTLPFGVDTPGYIFRARVVHDLGLNALTSFGERPGVPIVTSVLRDATGGSPLDLARASPTVFATAIALAAVALGLAAAGERSLVGAALGIGVGASAFVALTAVGNASNLMFDVFAVAAVAGWIAVSLGSPGAGAVVLLVTAAAATHWLLASGLIALLALDAAVHAVLRRSRDGTRSTPHPSTKRPVRILAAAVLFAAVAVSIAPELPSRALPERFPNEAGGKIERRLPPMALPVTLPLAAAGAAAMLGAGGTKRRRTAAPLVLWAAAAPAGLVAWYVLDLHAPPYRTAAVALGIPALIVLGAGAVWSWSVTRRLRLGIALGIVLVAVSAGWLADAGARVWSRGRSSVTTGQLSQASVLDAYVRPLPASTRIVIPVDVDRRRPLRGLQAGLEAGRYASVMAFPTDLERGVDALVREIDRRSPGEAVVVYLGAYHRHRPPEGTELGPGVVLLAGPAPAALPRAASSGTTAWRLVLVAGGSLAVLLLTGIGWTYALTRVDPVATIALAPAIGASTIVLAGLVWGRLGLPLGNGGGTGVAATVAACGLIAAGFTRRSRLAGHAVGAPRRREGGSPSAPPDR